MYRTINKHYGRNNHSHIFHKTKQTEFQYGSWQYPLTMQRFMSTGALYFRHPYSSPAPPPGHRQYHLQGLVCAASLETARETLMDTARQDSFTMATGTTVNPLHSKIAHDLAVTVESWDITHSWLELSTNYHPNSDHFENNQQILLYNLETGLKGLLNQSSSD